MKFIFTKLILLSMVAVLVIFVSLCILSISAYSKMSSSFDNLDYPKSVKSEYIGYTNSLIFGRLLREIGWNSLNAIIYKKQMEYYSSAIKKNNNELDKALWDLWPFYYNFEYPRTNEFLKSMSVICAKYPHGTAAKQEEALHSVLRGAGVYKKLIDTHPEHFGRPKLTTELKSILINCIKKSNSSEHRHRLIEIQSSL